MIPQAASFPFIETNPAHGAVSLLPVLPLALAHQEQSVSVMGTLDTASTVNVLPYNVGLQLGFAWEEQGMSVRLTGNLAALEARAVLVTGIVGSFPPVRLAFAWTKATAAPLLLGQVNFFMEFDVCVFRSQGVFEVKPKQK